MAEQRKRSLKPAALVGGPGDNPRAENDFYRTPAPVTESLCLFYRDRFAQYCVWEPFAGDGAMSDVLQKWCKGVIPSDIVPRRDNVFYRSVFDGPPNGVDAIVSNPPFRLMNSLLPLLAEWGLPFVALLLKSTFWHSSRRFRHFKANPPAALHPLLWRPDFSGLGAPLMDVMWCVWERGVTGNPVYVPFQQPAKINV